MAGCAQILLSSTNGIFVTTIYLCLIRKQVSGKAMKKIGMFFVASALLCSSAAFSQCEAAVFAYVANWEDGTVSVVRVAKNIVIATVDVGAKPVGVAVEPSGAFAYVANSGDNSIFVIQTADSSIYEEILDVGAMPWGLVIRPQGDYLYVANRAEQKVSVIDRNALEGNVQVTVGKEPYGVGISPFGDRVYVANRTDGTLSVIDTDVVAVIDKVTNVGDAPVGVAVSPNGDKVYVTDSARGRVKVVATSDIANTVVSEFEVGNEPFGVAVSPSGDRLYVANRADGTVSVIQIPEGFFITDIEVGNQPISVAVSPDGSHLYVTKFADDEMSVIETSNYQITSTITVGRGPTSLGNFVGSVSEPEGPGDLAVMIQSENEISFSWTDNSSDERGFTIERNTLTEETPTQEVSEDNYVEIDTVDPNVTTYSDTTVTPYTTYRYRIRAYNDHGNSVYSNDIEGKTWASLAAPSKLRATDLSDSRIRLFWTDRSSEETGVTIERMTVVEETDSETDAEDSENTDIETAAVGTFTPIGKVAKDVTSFSDGELEPYTTYRYRVQAYNDDGVSDYSNEAEARTDDDCFIATAAYGSLMEPHVVILRDFRDRYLRRSELGRLFIKTYYAYSPPAADVISAHETLRVCARIGLLPLVAFSYSALQIGPILTFALIGMVLLAPFGLRLLCKRRNDESEREEHDDHWRDRGPSRS
jgi:YVTN family beta-propeller protein